MTSGKPRVVKIGGPSIGSGSKTCRKCKLVIQDGTDAISKKGRRLKQYYHIECAKKVNII